MDNQEKLFRMFWIALLIICIIWIAVSYAQCKDSGEAVCFVLLATPRPIPDPDKELNDYLKGK